MHYLRNLGEVQSCDACDVLKAYQLDTIFSSHTHTKKNLSTPDALETSIQIVIP
jgi:hypothetical protein